MGSQFNLGIKGFLLNSGRHWSQTLLMNISFINYGIQLKLGSVSLSSRWRGRLTGLLVMDSGAEYSMDCELNISPQTGKQPIQCVTRIAQHNLIHPGQNTPAPK